MGRRVVFLLAGELLVAACRQDTAAPPPRVPHLTDIYLKPETVIVEAKVPRNATLGGLLREQMLGEPFVVAAIEAARAVFNPRQLHSDRPYRLVRSIDGMLREFEYQIDTDRFLRIIARDRSRPTELAAEVVPYEKQVDVVAVRGRIDSDHPSVIAAIEETGETIQLALAVAEIFSGEIDFDSDLQSGDSFDILVEKKSHDGQFSDYGAVLGARFITDGRDLRAIRWVDPATGKAAFYDDAGRSLKRFFLRSPLRFEPRVTSGFSRRRLHPVFRTYRAHLGIDYGAPTGAPVVAVSPGTVVSAGWSGGGGNMVRLRHASGYESYYLHLSSFAKGVRAGVHVDQGQLIGRVGATGTATGPHLDYRLRKNGVFLNPLTEHRKLPPGEPIPATQLAAFRSTADATLQKLSAALSAEAPPQKPDAITAHGR
ncbi:MAG TPA: peptidoglycan DD-metalloendopeptidase family protein [Vicinamibacterales bacterium]|nr:peptidoglycan DD-metalloendopeptidase family protein [Vicinamibacterales bacterium]